MSGPHEPCGIPSVLGRRLSNGLKYQYPRDRLAILLLLGGVDAVSGQVDRKAVNQLLHRKIFDVLKMIRVFLPEHGNESARTRGIDSADAGVKLNYIGAGGQRDMSESPCACPTRTP